MTMTTDNFDCDHDTLMEGIKLCIESVQSTAASASASSSLESQNFLVKISGHDSVLRRLLSFSRNGGEIITAALITISYLLRVSKSSLYFQKLCRSNENSIIPILINTVVLGKRNGIEGLLSTKSELYAFSHAAKQLVHLILGGILSSYSVVPVAVKAEVEEWTWPYCTDKPYYISLRYLSYICALHMYNANYSDAH